VRLEISAGRVEGHGPRYAVSIPILSTPRLTRVGGAHPARAFGAASVAVKTFSTLWRSETSRAVAVWPWPRPMSSRLKRSHTTVSMLSGNGDGSFGGLRECALEPAGCGRQQ
jgi:hypothetical protein